MPEYFLPYFFIKIDQLNSTVSLYRTVHLDDLIASVVVLEDGVFLGLGAGEAVAEGVLVFSGVGDLGD